MLFLVVVPNKFVILAVRIETNLIIEFYEVFGTNFLAPECEAFVGM